MLITIAKFLESLSFIDYVFFFVVLFLLVLIVCLLYFIKVNQDNHDEFSDLDNPDVLNKLVETMKEDAKDEKEPIKFTNYEKEQEEHAIISYDELLSNTGELNLKYINEEKKGDILVKQVDLNNLVSQSNNNTEIEKHDVKLLSFDKEEEFLKALKELQSNLM